MLNKFYWLLICVLTIALLISIIDKAYPSSELSYPKNLWKYVIAESASEIMIHGEDAIEPIVLVVKNRLEKNMNHGLCGAYRKDLDRFVAENLRYLKLKKGVDYELVTRRIIEKVFSERVCDYVWGAIYYENFALFGAPAWASDKHGDLDSENFVITYRVGSHWFFKDRD